jgi:hypothetical protein
MNCPTCGAQNLPNAAFCSQCSTNLMAPPGMPPPGMQPGAPMMYGAPPIQPRTSGMAIAGFILSFVCSLLGLIFSIIGYNECKRSNGAVTGGGLALAGIIISIISMLFGILWFAAASSASHGRF